MADQSAILALPYIQPAQAQKHVTHNEALRVLDLLVQMAVLDRTRTAPPATPLEGDRHLVAAGAIGAWAGQDGKLAVHETGSWQFLTPLPGWRALVLDEALEVVFLGGAWSPLEPQIDSLPQLGINATADATNRLAVAAAATLLNHAGAGHQLKLNKATPGDTASLLFQTGFSGRAEMGLTGSDGFAIKVSADGSSFAEALTVDPASGLPTAPQGLEVSGALTGTAVQQSPADITAGRVMRADYGYGPGNLLGSVAQSAGLPTGAVLERGSNANGSYLRLADGTQICFGTIVTSASAETLWTFPAAFIDSATISPGALPSSAALLAISPRMSTISTTGVEMAALNAGNARIAVSLRMSALGRWF